MGQSYFLRDKDKLITGYKNYSEGLSNNILHKREMENLKEPEKIKKEIIKILKKHKVLYTDEKLLVGRNDLKEISMDKYKNVYFKIKNKAYVLNLQNKKIEELEKYKVKKSNETNKTMIYYLEKHTEIANKFSESHLVARKHNNKWKFYPMIEVLFKYLEENPNGQIELIGEYDKNFGGKYKKYYKIEANEDYDILNKVLINNEKKEYINMKELINEDEKENEKFIPLLLLFMEKNENNQNELESFIDYHLLYEDTLDNEFSNNEAKQEFLKKFFDNFIGKWHKNKIEAMEIEKFKNNPNYKNYKNITNNINFYQQIEKEISQKQQQEEQQNYQQSY